jgi:hypothetical protein
MLLSATRLYWIKRDRMTVEQFQGKQVTAYHYPCICLDGLRKSMQNPQLGSPVSWLRSELTTSQT